MASKEKAVNGAAYPVGVFSLLAGGNSELIGWETYTKLMSALLGCGIMKGTFRAGVLIAVLMAVAAVLIAPNVDLPETVLREHHVVSHASGEHAQGKLQTSSDADPSSLLIDAAGTHLPVILRSTDHVDIKPFRVLRC